MNTEKIDKNLRNIIALLDSDKTFDCLVRTKDSKSYESYIKKLGLNINEKFPFMNSFSAKLSKRQLSSMSKSDSIVYISSVSNVFAMMNVAKKVLNIPSNCQGEGQTVCFIDTGICPHCDFLLCEDRILHFGDFVGEQGECYDDNGHGTFVAGVCAGSGILSGGRFAGVAPKAKIISLKALDKNGEASSTKILEAMQWIFENKEKHNIGIVCMSFGSDPIGTNDPIMLGAEKLWDSGLVVVAAAGNSGPEYQTIKSPGVSRKIITVGGFDDNRLNEEEFDPNLFEIASFSSRGPCYRYFKPDVVAPAVDIMSCGKDKNYVRLSGTSVATPMVAGICALIKEKDNLLSPGQIKSLLLSTCKPIVFNRNLEGYGVPDLSKLLS